MSKSIVLATISDTDGTNIRDVSINDYETMVADKDKPKIAEMIYHRFYGRYIKPFMFNDDCYKKHYKHGFPMMASACLLIEAIESFLNGDEETPRKRKGAALFEAFFKREPAFHKLMGQKFYEHVRCGILHQGETIGGFTIRRDGTLLFDNRNDMKRIDAVLFHEALQASLVAYKTLLLDSPWDSAVWDNLRRKMRFIIDHCNR